MIHTTYHEDDDQQLFDIAEAILTEANFRNFRRMGAEGAARGYRDARAAAAAAEEVENGESRNKPHTPPSLRRPRRDYDEDSPRPIHQGIGGGAERMIEELSRKYNEDIDKLYDQTSAEINAQNESSTKIAKLLGITSTKAKPNTRAVEVTIGRIQNAKSLWWNERGFHKYLAANNDFVNAADGARVPKGVMADRWDDGETYKSRPDNYYYSGSRVPGGISSGITPTIGTFANCVEVSIDWGMSGGALDKLIQVVKEAGLDLPGKGLATQDTPKDWGRVVVWTVRYLIWNSMSGLVEAAGFNVDDEIIMAVADTGDGNNAVTRLRFAVNTPMQNVLKTNKKLAETIGDYCIAKINITAKRTFNKYINNIVQKWSDVEGKTFFTPKGGILCDLLNELSVDSNITTNEINVFDVSKLPDISTTPPKVSNNDVQMERYKEAVEEYNKRAAKFTSTDQIFDEICWPLFESVYDETNMLETAIAEREARKVTRTGRIEFEQMDPDWTVSRYNFISARNAVDAFDTDKLETVVTRYNGTVKRVPWFNTGAMGMPADRRWKPANTAGSEEYKGKANQDFSRLKDLATVKI